MLAKLIPGLVIAAAAAIAIGYLLMHVRAALAHLWMFLP